MGYETIIYKKEGRIVFLTLNRPERLNAVTLKMQLELNQAWEQFKEDEDSWVAVVTGAGRALCVGPDLSELAGGSEEMRMRRTSWEDTVGRREMLAAPRAHQIMKPIITAVNGICCGAGLDFVTEADIVIASEKAEFSDPHVSIGVISNHEQLEMSRRIPLGLCLRMAIMGNADRVSAQRAYEIGLVSEVVPHEKLMDRATEIAEKVLEQAPLAVRGTKQCILDGRHMSLDQAIEHGEYIRRENVDTEDCIEGIRAFLEKRKPIWKGK